MASWHRAGVSWTPVQVAEESGWGHLQEEHQEDVGGAGAEAPQLGALGLARSKWGGDRTHIHGRDSPSPHLVWVSGLCAR